jgi:hypothetical protein
VGGNERRGAEREAERRIKRRGEEKQRGEERRQEEGDGTGGDETRSQVSERHLKRVRVRSAVHQVKSSQVK